MKICLFGHKFVKFSHTYPKTEKLNVIKVQGYHIFGFQISA